MNYFISAMAGLVEGLSSSLPLSESGHRRLFDALTQQAMPALLPLAVALGMALVFHKTIFLALASLLELFKKAKAGKFRWKKASHYQKMAVFAPVAAVPYWLVCLLQTHYGILEGVGSSLLLVGILLILNAGLLFIGDHSVERDWTGIDLKIGHAIKLGLFQAAAFLPGFSRLGMTLCMGRNMGFEKKTALEFSVLTGILALLGGELIALQPSLAAIADGGLWAVAFGGALIASIGGSLLLKALVKKDKTYLLMIYSALAGIAAMVLNFILTKE